MWTQPHEIHMDDGSLTPEDQDQPMNDAEEEMDEDVDVGMSEANSYSNFSNLSANKLSSPLQQKLDLDASPSDSEQISLYDPQIDNILAVFKTMPQKDQMVMLTQLLENTSITNIRKVRSLIEPHFQRDFLSCLPVELGMKIISNLTGDDMVLLAKVSKNWRRLSEDVVVWRSANRDINSLLPKPSTRIKGAWALSAQSHGINMPEHANSEQLARHRVAKMVKYGSVHARQPEKAKFMRMKKIEQNWKEKPIRGSCMLKGHEDHVITCMQIHGDILVTGSDDNTLKVWSIDDGELLFTLSGHTGGVWTSQISQCGQFIISGSTDRTVKVWSSFDGSLLHTLQGHTSTVRCTAMSGNILVTGSRDATLRVWNITTGVILQVLVGHHAAVRCVQFDGRTVVSGGYDFTVKVWDASNGACMRTLVGHTNRVYSLLFDSERSIVASGSLDTTIRVWDFTKDVNSECIAILVGHTSLTSGMQLRGHFLVSCNADSHIKIWDIRDGTCVHHLGGHRSAITSLQLFSDSILATSSDDGTVKMWDIKKGIFLRDLITLDSGGNGGCIWRLCSTPTLLACAIGSRNNTEETKIILIDFDSVFP